VLVKRFGYSLWIFILFLSLRVSGQLVQISGGIFKMGCNSCENDEKPEHEVTVSDFKMDSHEITDLQYDSCVQSGRCSPAHYEDSLCMIWDGKSFKKLIIQKSLRKPGFPVTCVTWHQAQAYCRSRGMKLPTEAQWEYAARGGAGNLYSWGNEPPTTDKCSYLESGGIQTVGKYKPNSFGLYDMTGNVWEWTADYYESEYYKYSESSNPSGPAAGLYRVIRGGGWYSTSAQLGASNRLWFSPDVPEASIGFRCVKSSPSATNR